MKIDGRSADKIAEELNRLGIPSPLKYKREQGMPFPEGGYADVENSKWSATTVIRILKDRVYTGTLAQGKQGKPNYKIKENVLKPESEWFITENAHEAIISDNDFELVQHIMGIDTRVSPKKENVYMFSGILICGCCGNRMTRKTVAYKDRKYFYYYCPTGKKHGCKGANMVKEIDLIECVTESIKAQVRNVAELDSLIDRVSLANINHELVRRNTEKLDTLQKQLSKCSGFKARLYESFVNGIIDKDDYKMLKKQYTEECDRYQSAIAELETEIENCMSNKTERLKWIEYFKEFENIKAIDRRTVIQLISSIHIYDKHSLQICFNYSEEYNSALALINQVKNNNSLPQQAITTQGLASV